MSRIKDLEIRGIRNFGDESAKAQIHFSKPLTLILGPNGTGKTTIIEALKYVTSGEYPPDSDRGKAFVHEPKSALNHTVKGNVKGRIIDRTGQELIVARTVQVTRQKNGTLKFQALDNTITKLDKVTKEKIQITNKCCDIDAEMLRAMGVSKPILNYVIFCHQEESNWPLEDGKKLKDRFDEIFDTSRYNKAMDTTTKLIKELNSELNAIDKVKEKLKDILDEAVSQEEQLRDKERRELEAKNRLAEIDVLISPADERMKEILEVKDRYNKLEEKMKEIQTDHKLTTSYIESLKKHIKNIHTGSKEELQRKLDDFDQTLTQKMVKRQGCEGELEGVERKEEYLSKKLAESRIQLGSLKQKKMAFDEKVLRRNELLEKALFTWDIPQLNSRFPEEEVKDYLIQIKNKFEESASFMRNKVQEHEREEKHVQREVDACRTEKTGIESEMSLKDKEKKEIHTEINNLREKIRQAGEAGNKLSSVESNLLNATNKYESLANSFDENSEKEKLSKDMIMKKELNEKLNRIDEELASLHQQSSQQAELELHQGRLKEKESLIASILNKHESDLQQLFNGDVPKKNFKHQLDKLQNSLANEKKDLTKIIENEQHQLTKLQTALHCKRKDRARLESELKSHKDKINSECHGKDYNELLLLQERKVKSLQDQRGIYANQSLMYEEYLKFLSKKPCCPLCERNFDDASEREKLKQKLNAEIKTSPLSLQKCETELKQEQLRRDTLQQLKPIMEQIIEIEDKKLTKMQSDETDYENKIAKCQIQLEDAKMVLLEPEEKLAICKSIIGDLALLDSHMNEKDSLSTQIETIECKMRQGGKIGNRSMQEAQNESQAVKKRLIAIENSIETIQKRLQDNQEKIQKAREIKNKLNEEVIQIRQTMQAVKQLKDKVNELYDKESSLDKSLTSLRQKLVDAEQQLTKRVEELNDLKTKNRSEQEKDTNFKSKTSTEIHELETVQKEVDKFISSKIEENLIKVEGDVDKIKAECDQVKNQKLTLEEKIRFLGEECSTQESGKKELENNVELLKKQEHLENVNEKLSECKTQLENLRFDDLKKEYLRLQEEKDQFEKEKNEIRGGQRELESSIKTLRQSLNQEKYRMARRNHREKQLQLVVQQEAISNLKAYVTVLDKAMINFHEERMNTVNKIMKQLWTLVYSGNDTSSIQIRVQTTEGIGDKKRSYNYKLVQVKRSSEMDMKGKCSAGQKVLASIIIRMALAETFCSECAVLALDEPTTNLDEENATNLAQTLSKVIQLRAQHQKNFQLIVISHDEKFISHLSNLSGKQMFQELYRNVDGYSVVRRRDMTEYTRNSSQNVDSKVEEDTEDEDEPNDHGSRNSRKRHLSLDDSPPHSRATKRRAR
ncbi:hypothetical protein QAD02_023623 [Eretmocerus hayati]|uniref:Uncharacterized protein n=1 Tax=Eretmocerus hayati TaxID=131215 RepID=A0ACC2PYT7_9HYME|nr:hypothetical protein QAD02_023623 [Eretmocerus hayati]